VLGGTLLYTAHQMSNHQSKTMPKCNGHIKAMRLEARLSQNALSRKADLDRSTISSAENGGEISELTLEKLRGTLSSELGREIQDSDILK